MHDFSSGMRAFPRLFYFVVCMLLAACARQGAPSGGPKDTQPPVVDSLTSTPNFSTHFNRKSIELKFNEWIVLSDLTTQVIVSPPLVKRPDIVLKGKTVVLTFDKNEVLRPNTTYTINFGNSIKDFHEGNAAKDLRFVFSTGDFIDSLSFKGVITDAFSGEPVENVSVMLYDDFADTSVLKGRPYYFCRTDKSGLYEFKNLRAGRFRVVAIEDSDQNLRWDGEAERIGTLDSALLVSDTLRKMVGLRLYKSKPKFRLSGQNANRYGLVRLGFNASVDTFDLKTQAPDGLKMLVEKSIDSLQIWYDLPSIDTSWSLVFYTPEKQAWKMTSDSTKSEPDTIPVKKLSRSEFLQKHKLLFGDVPAAAAGPRGRGKVPIPAAAPAKTVALAYSRAAKLPFNGPISSFDTAFWQLKLDSVRVRDFTVMADSAGPRSLVLRTDWKQGKNYTLTLYPGALTDFWGAQNVDTLQRSFSILPEKQLGILTLSVENLQPGAHYILQVLNGTVVDQERRFTADTDNKKLTFKDMDVAAYALRLIEDRNGNGRWDSGDFKSRKQPEPIINKKLDPLRANWELEANISTNPGLPRKKK